jgi:hypothetical protein
MVTRTRDHPPANAIRSVTGIDLRPLLGRWVNYNEHSTGITCVEIGNWEGVPTVRVLGAGRPAPIDWGEAAGAMFADGVGGQESVAFTVSYDFGWSRAMLAAYLNKRLLVVDAYTIFTDGSGRANYFQRDHFYRT